MQTTRGGIGAAERFLVAFQKYRADKIENSRSVMGAATPENTIFWHNMRTSESVRMTRVWRGSAMHAHTTPCCALIRVDAGLLWLACWR